MATVLSGERLAAVARRTFATKAESERRTATFDEEPGFYAPAGLWLHGNARLLDGRLAHLEAALGPVTHRHRQLEEIEAQAERVVLEGKILVCAVHNDAHRRAAIVPLRWGSPRILVLSGGFKHHLGDDLTDEPFRAARLWRFQWDPKTDLAVSRRAPDKLATFALHNPAVDRLVRALAAGPFPDRATPADPLSLRHCHVRPERG